MSYVEELRLGLDVGDGAADDERHELLVECDLFDRYGGYTTGRRGHHRRRRRRVHFYRISNSIIFNVILNKTKQQQQQQKDAI